MAMGVTCLFGAHGQALAEAAPNASAPTLSRQSLDPSGDLDKNRALEGAADDLLPAPAAGPCPLGQSPLRFTLQSVTFASDFVLARDRLASSYADKLNREIGLAEVCQIRDRAERRLYQEGFLARIEIPPQTIAQGRLELRVIAAHIESVQVHGDAGPAQERLESYIARLRGMKPFSISKAQRFLLLASQIPGIRLSAALQPAAGGEGAVDLIVFVSRKPVDAIADYQNYGSKALGRSAAVTRLDFNGFTPWGERTSLVYYSTLDHAEQEVVQLIEEVRPGSSGLTLQASASYGQSVPGSSLAALRLDGVSFVGSLGLDYPLIRSRRRNLDLSFGFDFIDQKTIFRQSDPLSVDHLRIASLGLDGRQYWRALGMLPAGMMVGQLEVRQGLRVLGASSESSDLVSRIGARSDALVARQTLKLQLNPARWLQLTGDVRGQESSRPLLAYEQFSLGVLSIGRGYDPASVTGDQAIAASLEARLLGLPAPLAGLKALASQASLIGFYDEGSVSNHIATSAGRTLRSAGLGLSVPVGRRFHLDFTYAHPFDRVSDYTAKPPPDRILINFSVAVL